MKTWSEAVYFLREEGFTEQSIVKILEEIRGIKLHHLNPVDIALNNYFSKVLISEDKELDLPFTLYAGSTKKSRQGLKNIIYAMVEDKKINKEEQPLMIYSDKIEDLVASLSEDFIHAFNLNIVKSHNNETDINVIFSEDVNLKLENSYLLAHEFETFSDKRLSAISEENLGMIIVAGLQSSVGSRLRLSIDTGVPLVCEIFEDTNFFDKFYYSYQLIEELKERGMNENYKRAI